MNILNYDEATKWQYANSRAGRIWAGSPRGKIQDAIVRTRECNEQLQEPIGYCVSKIGPSILHIFVPNNYHTSLFELPSNPWS
jgi:hypothetical protein